MYSPRHGVPIEHTTWPYRENQLKRDIAMANCDVVCLQEVCCDSFEQDFAFMKELGYDQSEMYRRGRFRPATFWKTSRVTITQSPIHRDRCLITSFEISRTETETRPETVFTFGREMTFKYPLYVANVHLQAGPHTADRRIRQVHDCLETIRKDASKMALLQVASFRKANKKKGKGKKTAENTEIPTTSTEESARQSAIAADLAMSDADLVRKGLLEVPIVLLGDTNCDPSDQCAVHALLLYGEADVNGKIDSNREAGDHDTIKRNKPKSHLFGHFLDAYQTAYATVNTAPPPTMICEELYGVLTLSAHDDASGDIYKLSPIALDTLRNIFSKFSSVAATTTGECDMSVFARELLRTSELDTIMNVEDVTHWLTTINGRPDRGSELRAAIKYMKRFGSTESDTAIAPPQSIDADDEEGGDTSPLSLPEDGFLTFEGFTAIYTDMVREGKVWAVSYDFAFCGYPLPRTHRVFTARYDRAYVGGSAALRLVAVRALGVGSVEDGCRGVGGCLPNSDHPSDHLPIAVAVEFFR